MQLDLFPEAPRMAPSDINGRAIVGASWTAGNWHCRNWRGWFQSREGGRGQWQFQVVWFGADDTTAEVYVLDEGGALVCRAVPIDSAGRLLIEGRRWGRTYWSH